MNNIRVPRACYYPADHIFYAHNNQLKLSSLSLPSSTHSRVNRTHALIHTEALPAVQ